MSVGLGIAGGGGGHTRTPPPPTAACEARATQAMPRTASIATGIRRGIRVAAGALDVQPLRRELQGHGLGIGARGSCGATHESEYSTRHAGAGAGMGIAWRTLRVTLATEAESERLLSRACAAQHHVGCGGDEGW